MNRLCSNCQHFACRLSRYIYCVRGYWHKVKSGRTRDYLRLAEHCADYEREVKDE